jgi:hypothetical protein
VPQRRPASSYRGPGPSSDCWPRNFWFSTGSLARHNLAANPQISMHLERGDQVVIGLQQHQAEDRERRLRILIEP